MRDSYFDNDVDYLPFDDFDASMFLDSDKDEVVTMLYTMPTDVIKKAIFDFESLGRPDLAKALKKIL